MAFGAEYRTEKVDQVSDPISQASGWRQINRQSLKGSFNVKEVYGEVGVPVLKDSGFGVSLDLNGVTGAMVTCLPRLCRRLVEGCAAVETHKAVHYWAEFPQCVVQMQQTPL